MIFFCWCIAGWFQYKPRALSPLWAIYIRQGPAECADRVSPFWWLDERDICLYTLMGWRFCAVKKGSTKYTEHLSPSRTLVCCCLLSALWVTEYSSLSFSLSAQGSPRTNFHLCHAPDQMSRELFSDSARRTLEKAKTLFTSQESRVLPKPI